MEAVELHLRKLRKPMVETSSIYLGILVEMGAAAGPMAEQPPHMEEQGGHGTFRQVARILEAVAEVAEVVVIAVMKRLRVT
ncbi:hypothetical protein D4A47_13350 [Anaerotruncus massiliensis (ex Liu et al. 2021)]|uniref:Uncharacterized protein n=2 Tax=Anaerotruncus TaxID=244127 RepID=A0A498CN12_9FIRM|nr:MULTISPECIES: hypothetical protein [Anaerotruncus]MBC3939921.1 hypothetical protein [Anaerotruncus massiliensis (ex Togo et al. 2019)]RLL06973.1 hypothetical protein D4A47_13350 [Anaerotruncus massiliensis (ex Liu et al. 2021)]